MSQKELTEVVRNIVSKMSVRGVFSLPRNMFLGDDRSIENLISEGILVNSDTKIIFVHQSFLDFFVVAGYLEDIYDGKSMIDFVGDRDCQTPNLRYRFFVLMQELCECDDALYIEQAKRILSSEQVRYYYQCIVFDVAAQQAAPSDKLCSFMEEYWNVPTWHEYSYQVVYMENYPLIRHLVDAKKVDVCSDEGMNLLRSISAKAPDYVAEVLRPYCFQKPELDKRLFQCLNMDVDKDSEAMYQLRQELFEKHPELLVDACYIYYRAMKNGSARAIDYIVKLIENDHMISDARIHFPEYNELKAFSEKYDQRIVDAVVPKLVQKTAGMAEKAISLWRDKRYMIWNTREEQEGTLRQIIIISKFAVCNLAENNPEQVLSTLVCEAYSESLIGNELTLAALENLPIAYADRVVDWLAAQFPKHIFSYTGSRTDYLAVTKQILEKFTPVCSAAVFQKLERCILNWSEPAEWMISEYKERRERSGRGPVYSAYWGFMQKELLPVLAQNRLSKAAKDLIGVLNRNEWVCIPHYLYPSPSSEAKWVTSPVSKYTGKLSDKMWLRIIRTPTEKMNGHAWRKTKDAFEEATNEEFAASLGRQAEKEPKRFAKLALRFPRDCDMAYVYAVLRAQEKRKDSPQCADVNLTSQLIRRYAKTEGEQLLGGIADIVESRAEEAWPEDMLFLMQYIAQMPIDKEKVERFSEREAQDGWSVYALVFNTPQGRAIRAITSLIFVQEDRLDIFRETIRRLEAISEPFIDVALVDCAAACYNADAAFSVSLFKRLIIKNECLLVANYAGEMIRLDYQSTNEEPRKKTDVIPAALQSTVLYENVYDGVDLQYDLFSYNIKESIILKAPREESDDTEENSAPYRYCFRLELANLTPTLQEDGSILMVDDQEQPIYEIPAPFMIDANGEFSDAVTYSLTQLEDSYLLTVEADAQWLEAEGRAYPVTIDPTIFSKRNESKFTGATAAQYSATSSVSGTQMACGYHPTHGEMQMYFHIDQLPKVDIGNTVVDAIVGLNMIDYIPEYNSSAKSVLSIRNVPNPPSGTSWLKNLTWNSKPNYDYAMDYVITHGNEIGSYCYWNVTRAAKDWYANGSTSCNLAVTSDQTSSTSYRAWFNYANTAVVIISYRNTTGIESYYTYEEQNILRAGNGYVGDYSSALTIVKDDLSFSSTSMPFTLSHVYNSDLHSGNISDSWLVGVTAADYINMRTGFGWQLSAQESVGKTTIGGTTYLVYRDGDGTMHFFTYDSSSGKYKDEDGLNLSIAAGSSGGVTTYTMTDEDGNTRFFYNSYLTYIKDANGNRICFVYNGKSFSATGTGWYPSTNGSYLSEIYAVSSGNASSSKICTLSYDQNHYLASITDFANRTTSFEYSDLTDNSAYLTKVTHPDKTTATYGYSSGWLNSAYDDESKYGVEYGYSGTEISSIEEYTDSARGSKILRQKNGVQETKYRYVGDDREATTDDDIVTKYTFDYAGRTINAVTLDNSEREVLGVTAAAYTTNTSRSGKNNRVEKDAQSGQNGINLLVAGGLETHDSFSSAASYWNRVTYPDEGSYSKKNAVVKTGEKARHGTSALKSYLSSASTADSSGTRYAGMYQTVTLSPGTYTFSAYINTTGLLSCDTNGGIYAAFADNNGNFLAHGIKVNYATNASVDDGWERVYVTYTVPTTGTYRCMVLAENAYGPVYYDDLQLERGSAASTTNLLQNGWFRSVTDPQEWTDTNLYLYNETNNESNYIGYLWGNPYGMKRASQTIPINKPATDTYLLSGWGAAYAAADNETALTDSTAENNSKRYFGLIARCNYSDGTKEYFYMPFNDDYPLWQYASCVIAPKKANQSKTLSSITVILAFDGNMNDKEFYMGAAFDNISLRQEPCNTYTYDSNGNVTAVNAAGSDSSFTYAAGNKLTKSQSKASGTYTYKYENSNNNHLVTKITNDNVSMNITYDKYGNSTKTTLSSDSNTSAGQIVTSASYSADGTQMTSQTDANGSTTSYTYNAQRNVSAQTDAKGTINNHSYFFENDRPKTNYITNVISAGYEYSCGNLVTVRRSGFITLGGTKQTQYYNMDYDGFGNMTSIAVGSRTLASYDYGIQNGNLRSMTYGNGATVSYTYDILDRVTEEKWNGTLKYQYFYNSEGDLAKKLDVTTGKAVNYEYDSLGRLIHSYQTDNGAIQQRTEHLYDSENRLVSQSWQLGDTLYKEAFTYSTADGSLTKVEGTGFATYAFDYDSLKRLSSRYNWIYRQNYTYRTNGGNQTTQIASIDYAKRDGGTGFAEFKLGYAYDAAGNITKITGTTRTDQSASYTYDAQNQLTSETNQKGTFNYAYDTYGNIRSVSGAESHTYTYGDSEWLDLLTAYDGKSITYDAVGNPAVWHNGTGDWKLSWANGRQLTTASNDNHRVSYTYDLAGIRDSKTVDGVTYNYITQNGQVVRQTWGSHVMDFIYDNTGKPCELKYNGTLYYYILNLQGDVIAIVSENGTCVATYTYDAWGNVIAQSGSIASLNPIRYRGYYYDSENGLYYLGSRYYDPQVKRFINADGAAFATINPYSNGLTDKNYFAYCDNNPVSRSDDGGDIWNIVVGAVVGGVASGISTLIECQSSGESLKSSLIQTAISATCGAIGGAVAGTGLGVAGQAITSGILGGVESIGRQITSDSKKVSLKKVGASVVSGLVGGMIGGNGAAWGQAHYNAQKRIAQNSIRKGVSRWKAAVNFAKQTWRWSRRLTKDTVGGVAKAFISSKIAGALTS